MSTRLYSRVEDDLLQEFFEDIAAGVLNLKQVRESILPFRDALEERQGYDEADKAEVWLHELEAQFNLGAEDLRFAALYSYDLDLAGQLRFTDDQGVLRLPRYRKPPATTAPAEALMQDDGSLYVEMESHDPYVVLDDVHRLLIHDGTDLRTQTPLTAFIPINARFTAENIHGAFQLLTFGQPLNSGSPINILKGTGKIWVGVLAGSDLNGSITVTGTSVDRETGATTPADTEVITLAGLTTDASGVDAQGNAVWDYQDAYITSKWFTGACVISTADVTLTDVDVGHVSFEQFNDQPKVQLETFDVNLFTTNSNAWFYGYLYTVEVTGARVNVARVSDLIIASGGAIANMYWRLREGNLDIELDGSSDGIFCQLYFGPSPQQYFEDITVKVWASVNRNIL